MRIAYLARRPIPSKKAHAVQIVQMCEAFAHLGHQVRLFAVPGEECCPFDRYGVDPIFDIEILPRRAGPFAKPRFLLPLLSRLRAFKPDLFYGRDIVSLALASLIAKPVIYEAHVKPGLKSPRGRLLHWLFARPNFSHLVCTTSTLADAYRRDYPALAGKEIMVAPNAAMKRHVNGKKCAQPAWPGRPGHTQVGFVGRPFPGKGIEAMINAAEALPPTDFHVVGAVRADVTWVEGVVPANVHFHGYQPHGGLDRFYEQFDIAAAPYGAEVQNASGVESADITSPLKLSEYLAAGLPTIASDLPGVRDLVGNSGAVALVEPGNHAQFAETVRRLSADPGLRQQLSLAAKQHYEALHRLEKRALRVLQPSLASAAAIGHTAHP